MNIKPSEQDYAKKKKKKKPRTCIFTRCLISLGYIATAYIPELKPEILTGYKDPTDLKCRNEIPVPDIDVQKIS
jgi:hypothetical protein